MIDASFYPVYECLLLLLQLTLNFAVGQRRLQEQRYDHQAIQQEPGHVAAGRDAPQHRPVQPMLGQHRQHLYAQNPFFS